MKSYRGVVVVAVAVVMAISCSLPGFAQGGSATLSGRVTDPGGLAVPNAKVDAVNVNTGVTISVSTNESGLFDIPTLPPGSYRIVVTHEGFNQLERPGVDLHVSDVVTLNFALQVGSLAQSVVVEGGAPLVDTTSSSLGGLVDDQKIGDLPLNGRNYADLSLLQPGVSQASYLRVGQLGQTGTEYSANGAGMRSNGYLLDGTIMNNLQSENGGSAVGTTLGVDGVREYRIITSAFSAQYGGSMGSLMVLVSKSGTNQVHGDAFEFLRNSALDARNFFDLSPTQLGHRLPEFRRNNFGGALGGPIKKDKTFIFGVYEGLSQLQGSTSTATVPQAGCHGAAGAVITLAACPLLSPTASVVVAPQMASYLALFPLPNISATSYGFTFATPTTDHYGQVRVDQILSNRDNLFVRYTIDQSLLNEAYDIPTFQTQYGGRNQFITLSEIHTFSHSWVNSAQVSFSRTNLQVTDSASINTNSPAYSFAAGYPMGDVRVSGLTTIGNNNGGPIVDLQNIFSYEDDLAHNWGHHSLKFGALVNHYQDIIDQDAVAKGRVQFANVAQFITGLTDSFTGNITGSILNRHYHFNTMGFYAQDDWHVTSRLTLNIGLRYEPWTTYTETNGYISAIRNPITDKSATIGPWSDNPSKKNFGPRIGFGWDVFGDGKTALRGGFAEMYDLANYGQELGNSAGYMPPFSGTVQVGTSAAPVNFTVPYILPAGLVPAPTARGLVYGAGQPHMLQYNLTAERQLPGSLSLSVSYVGSRGIDLVQTIEGNPNLPDGVPTAGDASCVAPSAGTLVGAAWNGTTQVFANQALYSSQIFGIATSCYPSAANRRNPAWNSLLMVNTTGDSLYNAMQVVVNKRLSSGLQLQSSYTWSKNIDDTSAAGGGDASGVTNTVGEDDLHEAVNRSVGDFDVTQNWRLNVIYHLPGVTSSSAFVSKLTNGWWTSAIYTMQTGYPFSVFIGSNRSNTQENQGASNPTDWPDVTAGRNNSNITHGVSSGCGTIPAGTPLGTPTLWFDPCAYTLQPAGFLGNAGRNPLRGPGLLNLDYSLVKDTAVRFLGESGMIQLRAEFFNILNHANFAIPGYPAGPTNVEVFASSASYLPSAGVVTATINNSRQIQFGLKIIF